MKFQSDYPNTVKPHMSEKSDESSLNLEEQDNRTRSKIKAMIDEIHEKIYNLGGIKPTNAAIDELGKLLFLKIHLIKNTDYLIRNGRLKGLALNKVFSGAFIQKQRSNIIGSFKELFKEISQLECYHWEDIHDVKESIFPSDEPFRLSNKEVLSFSIDSINKIWKLTNELNERGGRTTDLLGEVYEVFLRGKYEGAGGLGTYLTPTEITECMTEMGFELIFNKDDWKFDNFDTNANISTFLVGDICCGTGRFLISAIRHIESHIHEFSNFSVVEREKWIEKIRLNAFFGADQSRSSIWKARVNFLLYNGNFSKLKVVEDSITDKVIDNMIERFDLMLTNPPFGENKYTNKEGLTKLRDRSLGLELGWSLRDRTKPITAADPAILFLDRNIQLLKPGGYLLTIIPDGLLSNKELISYLIGYYDKKTQKVREGKTIPVAVVSLPTVTFSISGAIAKTSFIFLKKKGNRKKSRPPTSIFFASANHVGFLKKANKTIPDPKGNDLITITRLFKKYLIEKEEFRSPENIHAVIISETQLNGTLDPISYHRKINQAKQAIIKSGYPIKKLEELVKIRKKNLIKRNDEIKYYISILHVNKDLEIDWEAAASFFPKTPGQRCESGDILFSCINPSKPRIAVIPYDITGRILCSPEFAVLEPKEGVISYYLAMILSFPSSINQIAFKATGTSSSRRRIKKELLYEILIPLLEEKDQKRVGQAQLDILATIQRTKDQNRRVKEELFQKIVRIQSSDE